MMPKKDTSLQKVSLRFLVAFAELVLCLSFQVSHIRHHFFYRHCSSVLHYASHGSKYQLEAVNTPDPSSTKRTPHALSRRAWFEIGAVVALGAVSTVTPSAVATDVPLGAQTPRNNAGNVLSKSAENLSKNGPAMKEHTTQKQKKTPRYKLDNPPFSKTKVSGTVPVRELSVNVSQVVSGNTINVTVVSADDIKKTKTLVAVDRKDYTKIGVVQLPHSDLLLPIFRPTPKVLKEIPNSELLIASVVAGAATESVRTAALYPLSTVKARIQVRQGNLYAGLLPSLLVTVPVSGVYCGIRDVTKRMLNVALTTPSKYDDLVVALVGALVADVVAVAVRTPADALSLRLQVKKGYEDEEEAVGNWFTDSLVRIPAIIITDLPYLLSRIALNKLMTSGNEDLERYELITVLIACAAAALTTPFDVARTRILVDSDNDPSNGVDGGSGEGVLETMVKTTKEGDGGVRNLFAGWFERTAYLGIGRAWLDPIRLIGYLGIRDAVLLEWFD